MKLSNVIVYSLIFPPMHSDISEYSLVINNWCQTFWFYYRVKKKTNCAIPTYRQFDRLNCLYCLSLIPVTKVSLGKTKGRRYVDGFFDFTYYAIVKSDNVLFELNKWLCGPTVLCGRLSVGFSRLIDLGGTKRLLSFWWSTDDLLQPQMKPIQM